MRGNKKFILKYAVMSIMTSYIWEFVIRKNKKPKKPQKNPRKI